MSLDVTSRRAVPEHRRARRRVLPVAGVRLAQARQDDLPDVGMKGNSHLMMQDRNNLQVADFVLGWIANNVR
jgi:hypothetical protein